LNTTDKNKIFPSNFGAYMQRIKIDGLFGRFDYDIKIENNDIVIITGPNGYGKTTILKILYALYENDHRFFTELNFSKIEVVFSSTKKVTIVKEKKDVVVNHSDIDSVNVVHFKPSETEADSEGEELEFFKDGRKFHLKLGVNKKDKTNAFSISSLFHESFFGGKSCSFVKAQRLYDEKSKDIKINEYSADLATQMKNISLEAAKISQKLDSSFPSRLFSSLTDDTSQTSSDTIVDRLLGLELIKKNLVKYNLIETDDMFSPLEYMNNKISLNSKDVLELYISDALEKLSPYDHLYEKINLFDKLITEKSFAFKKLKIGKNKGFYFVDDKNNDIPLSQLSSGEQNQVILYYSMIFSMSDSNIVLIDEPEISLHVAWQKEFVESIEAIQKLNGIENILIATHSPQIVNNRWEDGYFDLFSLNETRM